MPYASLLVLLLLCLLPASGVARPKTVRVFVALCDNKTQGIAPVGERIGNGDDADANLYWGCSDGLGSYFRRSARWKVVDAAKDISPDVLRSLRLLHRDGDVELIAEAWRGSRIRECLEAFEGAVARGEADLVVFIGHNGLMDGAIPEISTRALSGSQAMVLCCLSQSYFAPRLQRLGAQPLLLTRQLMYPGSFILHDALEEWKRGASWEAVRAAAGRAYARNQKISLKAALGIFAPLEK